MPTKAFVEITAYWGNDDAISTIKLSQKKWREIQAGTQLVKPAWSYYEGNRYRVLWSFSNSEVKIDGEDGRQCVVDLPVDELVVEPLFKQRTV